ncbi:MAG: AlpA family phage regulatory protein [Caldimonas sp.]
MGRHSAALEPVFLRMPTVMRMTGLGRSTIYRALQQRPFHRPPDHKQRHRRPTPAPDGEVVAAVSEESMSQAAQRSH